MMNKNICFFCGSLSYGGAERVISILSNTLSTMGYNVEIVLYYDKDIFYNIQKEVKIRIIEKETGTKKIWKNYFWLNRYFSTFKGSIISFLAPFNILSLLAHINCKNKIIVADRNDPRKIPQNIIIRLIRNVLYRLADGVVVQTKSNKDYFSHTVQRKSIVIYNPVDLGDYTCAALKESKNKEIVTVGRLNEQKNQGMLIDAFAEIHKTYPEYRLVIYGEGPLRKKLIEKTQILGIFDSVDFPGSVKNIFPIIVRSKIFVLTSKFEGMPNALIEAMCLGLPVISTKVSGAIDLIENNINGVLVEVDDVDGLVRAIQMLLKDNDKELSIAKAATELNKTLSVEAITKQWIDYIEGVCR